MRNKNGEARRWGRKTDSAEGALGRRLDCAGQGDWPRRLRRCLPSGTCDDTDRTERAWLLRRPWASWSLPWWFGVGTLSAVPRCLREALLSPAAQRAQEADPRRESRTVGALGMNLEGGGSRGGEFGMSSVSCGNGKLRQWLIDQIDSGKYPGLVWENEEKSIFRIPWKHAGKQDYNREEDAALFKVTRTWGARGRDGGRAPEPEGSQARAPRGAGSLRGAPWPAVQRGKGNPPGLMRWGGRSRASGPGATGVDGPKPWEKRSFTFSNDFTNSSAGLILSVWLGQQALGE